MEVTGVTNSAESFVVERKYVRDWFILIGRNQDVAGRWPATPWVHYTTSCNT